MKIKYIQNLLFILGLILYLAPQQLWGQCNITTAPQSDCYYDDISGVDFATVTSNNLGCGDYFDGHSYYTSPVRIVTKGQNYSFTITHGFFPQYCAIWIDFDNNGLFDTSEMIYSSTSPQSTHSGNVTIPSGAATAIVRMRVRSDGYFPFLSNEACISTLYGETEDYDINIQAPPPLDVAARTMASPLEFNCGGVFPVSVQIINYGGNTINFASNNVTVSAAVTGTNPQVFTPVVISTGTLAPSATLNVQVAASYTMTTQGTYTFNASATMPGDGNTSNDAMAPFSINISNQTTLPVTVDFSTTPTPAYQVQQVAGSGNWTLLSGSMSDPTLAPVIGTGMAMFESYTFGAGTVSRLITPCYNFTTTCLPVFEFWMSQDNQLSFAGDSVAVKVSTDGGQTYSSSLLTATRYNSTFSVPGWRLFSVPLTAYAGLNGVRVALEATSDWGNNIGVDAIIVRNDTMARLSGNATVCTGSGANLSVNFTGNSPFNITYTDGVTPVTVTGITANPYIFSVSPTVSRTYSLTAVSNACGTGLFNGNGIVNVNALPTSTMSGSQTICAGTSGNISINLTGTQPWNITWTDGTANNVVNGIASSPYVLSVTPTANTTYSVNAISDAICTGTSMTGTHVITINPTPTATLSGNSTICPAAAANIAVALTGQSPWSVTYTDGVTPVTVTGITSALRIFSVTPSANTTYTLTSVSNICGNGTFSGTATIYVSSIATATLSGGQTICAGSSAQLSVTFVGASPWSFTYTNGTTPVSVPSVTANPYLLNVTPSASTTYSLTQMSNPCGSGLVSGTANIIVNNNPAASISANSTVCAGNPVTLTVNLTGNGPWDLTYTDGTTPQTQNGIGSSPYIVSVTPVAGNTYSITSLTDGMGCVGTNLGTPHPIQIKDIVNVSISSDQTICGSTGAVLSVTLNSGDSPYDFSWSDGATTFTETGVTASPYLLNVTPAVTTTYSFVNAINACGTVNPSSTAVLTILTSITANLSGPSNVCAGNSVMLTLTVSGAGPYNLSYTDGSSIATEMGIAASPYTFSVTPLINNTYDIDTLHDANGCYITGGSAFSITVDSLPTASLSGSLTTCEGAGNGLWVYFTGSGPYDLSYDDGSSIINVPGISTNPWQLMSSTVAGTTSYVLMNVSNTQCGAGSVSGSGTIIVLPEPTSVLSGNAALCGTNTTTLTVNLTGVAPWSITYTDGGSNFALSNITTSPYVFTVTPSVNPAVYSILNLSDNQCMNGVNTGGATVNLGSPPNATMSGNNSVCSGGNLNLTFNLTGTAPFTVTYLDGTVPVVVNGIPSTPYVHVVNPTSPSTYTLVGATDQFCSNNTLMHVLPVGVTPLPTASFTPVLVYGGQITTFNNSLYGTTYSWDFGDMSGTVNGFQPIHTYAANGVYTITLTVTNGCGSASTTQTVTISSVSVNPDAESAHINIYPNPNTGKFKVLLQTPNAANAQAEIVDMKGMQIWKGTLETGPDQPENVIDLSNVLSKGIYMLQIHSEGRLLLRKITIE